MISPNINVSAVQKNIETGCIILQKYQSLINTYVLDFYTEDHWAKLPDSWKCMKDLSTDQIAELLNYEIHSKTCVLPLTILTMKVLFQTITVSRKQNEDISPLSNIMGDRALMNLFWKHVKLKKRHEIPIMARLCHDMAVESQCFHIVDVGSGLGHLSRMLTYGYGFTTCSIEGQNRLIEQAGILDKHFSRAFLKKYGRLSPPRHVNMMIQPNITNNEFLNVVQSTLDIKDINFRFGIVGLHPCGDLGPTLLRLFTEIPNITYINLVGCCYNKLSTIESTLNPGFPLSRFSKQHGVHLDYHCREIACHAIENYIAKLYAGEHWKLKIHAYRAALEKILREMNPECKHLPLANVKYTKDLDFKSYCKKAMSVLINTQVDPAKVTMAVIQECLDKWYNVVLYYSFRLFFAPLIESLILHDRVLFLHEEGIKVELIPGFESKVSPRMHILKGQKLL